MSNRPNQREYNGESELEYYGLLSPDDGPELDDDEEEPEEEDE